MHVQEHIEPESDDSASGGGSSMAEKASACQLLNGSRELLTWFHVPFPLCVHTTEANERLGATFSVCLVSSVRATCDRQFRPRIYRQKREATHSALREGCAIMPVTTVATRLSGTKSGRTDAG